MLISHKRRYVAASLRATGSLALLERFARGPCLIVLNFHRIGDPVNDSYYEPVISATPENFRCHIDVLKRHYRLVELDEALNVLEGISPLDDPSALVTFDDGYRDNLALALPILRELGVPAAFFLTTGFLDRPRLYWWDYVAFVLKQTKRPRIILDYPEPLTIDLEHTTRTAALPNVIDTFLRADPLRRARYLDHLAERAEVDVAQESRARELLLSWNDVRELAHAGMAIGSHTRSHVALARLPESSQREELIESKGKLEGILGRPVTALAYPYGAEWAFGDLAKQGARKAGYRVAFSVKRGVIRPGACDRFELPRFEVGSADSPTMLRAREALVSSFGRSLI